MKTSRTRSQQSLQRSRLLGVVLALTFSFLLVEVAGALFSGSLALLADAGHMLTDVGGLALAILAIRLGIRPATAQKTYGYYRAEILAALVNAIALLGISGYILYEAYSRFRHPPEVQSLPMIAVASAGLVVNIVGIWLLRQESKRSLNVEGAFLEVLSDTLSSLGVIVAGLIILTTRFYLVDTIFSVLIAVFILPRTWRLLNKAVNILLEGAPPDIDLEQVRQAILALPGVLRVHDLHIWSITSGLNAMSGHIQLKTGVRGQEILENLRRLLNERFSIEHTTIQFEEEDLDEPGIHD